MYSAQVRASQVDMELLVSNFLQYKAIRKKADLGKKCFLGGIHPSYARFLTRQNSYRTELETFMVNHFY